MDGWTDLLLKALVLSLETSLSSLSLLFETWLPLSLSFFVMLLWHAIFSLFGATII